MKLLEPGEVIGLKVYDEVLVQFPATATNLFSLIKAALTAQAALAYFEESGMVFTWSVVNMKYGEAGLETCGGEREEKKRRNLAQATFYHYTLNIILEQK